jgi:putative Holliday junction resolvase
VRHGRIVGIDFGEKNVGVAVSDELGFTAQGLGCLRRRGDAKLLGELCGVVREKQAGLIVVGLPRTMRGEIGEKAREAMRFAEKLREAAGVKVSLWDERLTTIQAERCMLEGDLSRGKRRKKRDMLAAQLILQSFLDSRGAGGEASEGEEKVKKG